jgi:hypothetical protein
MGIFDDQIAFIDKFENDLFLVVQGSIEQFGFVIKDFIVNKQLFQKGIDGDGEKLPGYKRTTIRIKLSKGQPVDRTTLHDTEKFVGSIVIDAFDDRFEVGSNVSYDKFIVKRYGKNVLKPTQENFEEFLKVYFLPKLKKHGVDELTR